MGIDLLPDGNNQINLKFYKNLAIDSMAHLSSDNLFVVFISINNILTLIYINNKNSLISYDLINEKKINEIKMPHTYLINFIRYYLDIINKRDLILSVENYENEIRLWDYKNFESLLFIKQIYKIGIISHSCFLNDNNLIYIALGNSYIHLEKIQPIKVIDLNGNTIKQLNDSYNQNDSVMTIESFYDNKLKKNYIISGNLNYIKSYDYNDNKLYHKYEDTEQTKSSYHSHTSLIITNKEDLILIMESSYDSNIRVWNFHSAELLIKIKSISNVNLNSICLWNSDYLLVGCDDKTIKVIDLNKRKVISSLKGHEQCVLTIRKLIHPKYGECLISQGFDKDTIKLWINKNYKK